VVALYPDSVAGRLSVPQDKWILLYGGPAIDRRGKDPSSNIDGESGSKEPKTKRRSPSPTGSIRDKLKTGITALLPSAAAAEVDTASTNVKLKQKGGSQFNF
jgi:Vam6/Vps39-like protein vacuolar protein sorting-associated protein 39